MRAKYAGLCAGNRTSKVERPRPVYRGKTGHQRKLQEIEWSPGQESNLDLTLRRRVHCPLCYREGRASLILTLVPLCGRGEPNDSFSRRAGEGPGARLRGLPAAPRRSIRADPRIAERQRLLNKRAGQLGDVLARFKAHAVRCYPHGLWIKSRSSSHHVTVPSNVSNAP